MMVSDKITIGTFKVFKCALCGESKVSVIKIEDKLICLQCRFYEIGQDALYEPLYSNFD